MTKRDTEVVKKLSRMEIARPSSTLEEKLLTTKHYRTKLI